MALDVTGSALDVTSAWYEAKGGPLSPNTRRSLAYDATGFVIPVVPDVLSLLDAFFNVSP